MEMDKLFTLLATNHSPVWPPKSIVIAPLKSGLGKFPKISPEKNQVRFCTGYVEVIAVRFEPHLNQGCVSC